MNRDENTRFFSSVTHEMALLRVRREEETKSVENTWPDETAR